MGFEPTISTATATGEDSVNGSVVRRGARYARWNALFQTPWGETEYQS
jgi:hypothetical protein